MLDKLLEIPISETDADFSWNGRLHIGEDSDGPDEHQFSDLVTSLVQDGQDTPVTVRESGKRYQLGVGFRRFRAFQRIYADKKEVPGVKAGHIKAIVRKLSDIDMLALNGRENIARNNLNMADKAFLIHRLEKEGKYTPAQISEKLGLSLAYVYSLRIVYKCLSELRYTRVDGTDTTVFQHWREAPGRVSYEKLLELSRVQVDPKLKELKYVELLKSRELEASGEESGPKRSGTVKNDAASAERFGRLLGNLEKAGLIRVEKQDWRALLEMSRKVTFARGAPQEYVEKIVESATRAYWRAIEQGER